MSSMAFLLCWSPESLRANSIQVKDREIMHPRTGRPVM